MVRGPLIVTAFLLAACSRDDASTATRSPETPRVDAERSTNGTMDPLQTPAPADGWWEADDPCPVGTTLVVFEGGSDIFDVPSIDCRRSDGTRHGPSTTFGRNGERLKAGHYRNGMQHGEWRSFYGALTPDDVDVSFYDEGVGVGTWRSPGRETTETLEHRTAREVYRTVRRDGRVVEEGLLVDGRRQGAWTIEVDGSARQLNYVDGKADGKQSISGVPECDAFADVWSQCLATKDGADRYDMARTLAILIDTWETLPALPGEDAPLCLTHIRKHVVDLKRYGCAR